MSLAQSAVRLTFTGAALACLFCLGGGAAPALDAGFWATLAPRTNEEKRQALTQALGSSLTPEEAGTIHVVLGRLYELDNQPSAAARMYADPTVAASDLHEYAAFWTAQLLEKQGRKAEAAPRWSSLFDEKPQPSFKLEAAAALSQELLKAGRKAEAIPYVEALYAADPTDVDKAASLAALYEDTGQRPQAEALAISLWSEYPADGATLAFFKTGPSWGASFKRLPNAVRLSRLRNLALAGALQALGQELPSFKPATPDEAAWVRFLQGRLAEGRGRAAEAVAIYRSVKSPDDAVLDSTERMGLAAAKGGLPQKLALSVEETVLSLPSTFKGRERALLALFRWRDRARQEDRACELAAGLLSAATPQWQASEYLYKKAWEQWMKGKRVEALKLWRALIQNSPAGNDDRLAAWFVLLRLNQLRPDEAQAARQEILREDRYGYFGYRLRGSAPKAAADPLPPLSECPAPPGSHAAKAKKLLLVGFPSEAIGEYRMAGKLQKDLRTDWAMAQAQFEAGDHAGAIRSVRRVYPRAYNESGDSIPDAAWRLIYPLPFAETVGASAGAESLPYIFVSSVIRQESLWDESAVSHSGALGLMQLMPATARTLARRLGLPPPDSSRFFDPAWNTRVGCAYLGDLMSKYQRRAHLALIAYNAGPGRVQEWQGRPGSPRDEDLFVESVPFRETRSYVRRIFLNYWEYGRLYPELNKPGALPELELVAEPGK